MNEMMTLCISLFLALISCQTPKATVVANQSSPEDDIREAVFRYQFQHNASGLQQRASVYFLSFGELGETKDPGDAFMKRFEGHQPLVKKVSQCTFSPDQGVKDKETGQRGLIFRVTSITWISDTEVEVEGGYYEAGVSASGNLYRVARDGGRWVVKEEKMRWIS